LESGGGRMIGIIVYTSITCIIISQICASAFIERAKREGYKVARKSSFPEKLKGYIILCIPILNIVLVLIMLFMPYEEILKNYLNDGTLKEGTP
jgi:hypothetical protein